MDSKMQSFLELLETWRANSISEYTTDCGKLMSTTDGNSSNHILSLDKKLQFMPLYEHNQKSPYFSTPFKPKSSS